MPDTRSQILITMARLIEKQGYHATGLNEIIRESGTPKGSLYYYFPEGKEQIGAEAILESGVVISTRLRGLMENETNPAQAIPFFMQQLASNMEAQNYFLASPLTTAAIETSKTSERINLACRDAFNLILDVFRERFLASGYTPVLAEELSMYITTIIEGGIMMSRTYHDAVYLRLAAKHLQAYLINL